MSQKPLTREEVRTRLDEAFERAGANIQVMIPMGNPEFESLGGKSSDLQEKLFKSGSREEQEKLLLEIETMERKIYEMSEKYMAAARESDKGKMERECEELVTRAVERVARGEERQAVYSETSKSLEDVEEGRRAAWKGGQPRVAHTYIEQLAGKLKIERHLFPWEIEGRLAAIRKGAQGEPEGLDEMRELERRLFESWNRQEQEGLLKKIEVLLTDKNE